MSTEISVVPHPNSLAARANKHQLIVIKGWRQWAKSVWDETGQTVDINDPELEGVNVKFDYARMGYLYEGLTACAKFLRWLQDNVPEYDENEIVVSMGMNGNLYPVLPGDDDEICKATVERVNNEARDAYRKTAAYAEQQERQRKDRIAARKNMRKILRELRPNFSYLEMCRWLARFIPAQDTIGHGLNLDFMYMRFERMGYVRGEGVFKPPIKPVGIEAEVRYLVGQVMSFYRPEKPDGFGPCWAHPMLGEMAAKTVRKHLESAIEERKQDEQNSSVDRISIGSNNSNGL